MIYGALICVESPHLRAKVHQECTRICLLSLTGAESSVRLGPAANGYYSVLAGSNIQDEILTEGSSTLKTEAARQHPELH